MLKKIVVIGPKVQAKALCAKSWLIISKQVGVLSLQEYLLTNGTEYNFEDLLTIAQGQITLEDEYTERIEKQSMPLLEAGGHIPLFIDTDMYVMKVWCEFVFGKCHRYVLDQIVKRKYDLYLLCNTDLPWVKDELREYPDLKTREKLFYIYKDIMVNQNVPWVEIKGCPEERTQLAIESVQQLMKKE
jgi:nicotinamide riboside kinase